MLGACNVFVFDYKLYLCIARQPFVTDTTCFEDELSVYFVLEHAQTFATCLCYKLKQCCLEQTAQLAMCAHMHERLVIGVELVAFTIFPAHQIPGAPLHHHFQAAGGFTEAVTRHAFAHLTRCCCGYYHIERITSHVLYTSGSQLR